MTTESVKKPLGEFVKMTTWPDHLMLRDTGIYDDLGGLGQRIYTTAGAGYEKHQYVRIEVADAALASLRDQVRERDARIAELHDEQMRSTGDLLLRRAEHRRDVDMIGLLRDELTASRAEAAELRADAENWRALMNCRMRTIGGAGVNKPDEAWTYLVIELWTGHPDPTDQPWLKEHFAKFMNKAKAALSPKETPVSDKGSTTEGGKGAA